MSNKTWYRLLAPVVFSTLMVMAPTAAQAHCDSMDGPVVTAARRALEDGSLERVLIWVPEEAEEEVRSVFEMTLHVRALGDEAAELADRFFFETVVRLHRASEGEPFTGLRPAGVDPGPVVPVADRAIEMGAPADLMDMLTTRIREGIEAHLHEVMKTAGYAPEDITAGRAYVAAYVRFMHYAEHVFEVAGSAASSQHDHSPGK